MIITSRNKYEVVNAMIDNWLGKIALIQLAVHDLNSPLFFNKNEIENQARTLLEEIAEDLAAARAGVI